ncbi:MAG: DUF1472 domain-containing protein [Gemmatimonas sp.]|nr:DUF1472 domain-containing protein [Gemmatimonas sp.]
MPGGSFILPPEVRQALPECRAITPLCRYFPALRHRMGFRGLRVQIPPSQLM